MLRILNSALVICALILTSCSTNQDVVNNGLIQKRKYRKGFHVNSIAKKQEKLQKNSEKYHSEELAGIEKIEPESQHLPDHLNQSKSDSKVEPRSQHEKAKRNNPLYANASNGAGFFSFKTLQPNGFHLNNLDTDVDKRKTIKRLRKKIRNELINKAGSEEGGTSALGIIALILGILGLILTLVGGFIPYLAGVVIFVIGLMMSIAAIATGAVAKDSLGKVGMILGIITLALMLLILILVVVLVLAIL